MSQSPGDAAMAKIETLQLELENAKAVREGSIVVPCY
jgi:hypothetical protein